jgi:hypothetical protein
MSLTSGSQIKRRRRDGTESSAKRPLPFSFFLRLGRIFGLSYEAAPNGKLVEFDGSEDEVGTIIPERKGLSANSSWFATA